MIGSSQASRTGASSSLMYSASEWSEETYQNLHHHHLKQQQQQQQQQQQLHLELQLQQREKLTPITVLDFTRFRENPWLLNCDPRLELSGFEANFSSKLHRLVIREFDFQMKFSNLKLVANEADYKIWKSQLRANKSMATHDEQAASRLSNTLRFEANQEPPRWFEACRFLRAAWSLISTSPGCYIAGGIFFYVILKLTLLTYVCYKHDKALKLVQTSVAPDAVSWGKCYLARDLSYEPAEASAELEESNRLMRLIGATFFTTPGTGVLTANIHSMLAMAYVSTTMLLMNAKRIRVDQLYFIENPLGERARIRTKLGFVVKNIIAFLAPKETGKPCMHYTSRCDCPRQSKDAVRFKIGRKTGLDDLPARVDLSGQMQFIESIGEIVDADLVRPANLTSEWHRRLTFIAGFSNATAVLISSSISFAGFFVWIVHELYCSAARRVAELECQSWRDNATLAGTNHYWLEPIDSSDDLRAYKTHRGGFLALLQLALSVEIKYYLTRARLLLICESCALISLYSIWASFFSTLFIIGFFHQLVRLIQLDAQLNDCVRLVTKYELELTVPPQSSGQRQQLNRMRADLLRKLTIGYLNYELFRRDHLQFENLSSFLFSQVVLLTANTFIICYVIANHLDPVVVAPIVWTLLAIVFIMDLYLVTLSYNSKKCEKVERTIVSLVIHCTTSSISNSYPVELWRRQLPSDTSDQGMFFNSTKFVKYMSYEKLLAFNAYLLILWHLLVTKSFERGGGFFF